MSRDISSEASDGSGGVRSVLPEAIVERATKASEQPVSQDAETPCRYDSARTRRIGNISVTTTNLHQ